MKITSIDSVSAAVIDEELKRLLGALGGNLDLSVDVSAPAIGGSPGTSTATASFTLKFTVGAPEANTKAGFAKSIGLPPDVIGKTFKFVDGRSYKVTGFRMEEGEHAPVLAVNSGGKVKKFTVKQVCEAFDLAAPPPKPAPAPGPAMAIPAVLDDDDDEDEKPEPPKPVAPPPVLKAPDASTLDWLKQPADEAF